MSATAGSGGAIDAKPNAITNEWITDWWLKRENFHWFRRILENEPDEAKRRALEQKLAEAEAIFEARWAKEGREPNSA